MQLIKIDNKHPELRNFPLEGSDEVWLVREYNVNVGLIGIKVNPDNFKGICVQYITIFDNYRGRGIATKTINGIKRIYNKEICGYAVPESFNFWKKNNANFFGKEVKYNDDCIYFEIN